MNKIQYYFSFLLLISYLLLLAPKAHADEHSFTISPPTTEINLNPGDTSEGQISIRNNSQDTVTFQVLTEDYIVDNNQGIPTLLENSLSSNKFLAKDWFSFIPSQFSLQPNQKQIVEYAITAPSNATTGGHYAALVFQAKNPSSSASAQIIQQLASLFLISVNGPVNELATAHLSSQSFKEYGPILLTLTLKNQGDIHIKTSGNISLYDIFNRKIATHPVDTTNIFPEASRIFHAEFGSTWMIGPYTVKFIGTYGQYNNLPLLASTTIWIIPWKVGIVILLVVIILVLGTFLAKKDLLKILKSLKLLRSNPAERD